MTYRVLGLDPYSQHMSLPVLRAIYRLVENGAVVAGPKPTDDPSLADDQAEFARLSNRCSATEGGSQPRQGTGIFRAGPEGCFQRFGRGPGLRAHQCQSAIRESCSCTASLTMEISTSWTIERPRRGL